MSEMNVRSRRDDRRDAILDAARESFVAEGYAAASMSSIAARLGGSKGTLYNYFKCKEDLFDAFVRRACTQLGEQIFGPQDPALDLRTRLIGQADGFIGHLLSKDALILHRLVVGEGVRFPELSVAFYAAGPKIVYEALAADFAEQMARGRLRKADPSVAAHQFTGLALAGMHHLRVWGVIDDPTPEEIHAQAVTAVDAFLRAYASESPEA